MSLDKAIEHGKEHRKPYRGSKAIDKTCRNHGGCPWCEGNRKHKMDKRTIKPEEYDVLTLHDMNETVPIVTDDGRFCCDACGYEIKEDQAFCGNCKREIDWTK